MKRLGGDLKSTLCDLEVTCGVLVATLEMTGDNLVRPWHVWGKNCHGFAVAYQEHLAVISERPSCDCHMVPSKPLTYEGSAMVHQEH